MKLRATAWVLIGLLACAASAAAQDSVVYVVRHAERADSGGRSMIGADDPPLSETGKARAERLAAMLRSAGITHIFTTEFQRTRQTAAPLAEALKISPVMAAAKDTAALVRAVTAARGPALVVGHSNTVPEILSGLGVKEKITIAEQDYGNLFVVVRHGSGPPTLLHLRF